MIPDNLFSVYHPAHRLLLYS